MNEFTDFGHYYNNVPLLSEERLIELLLAFYGFYQSENKLYENGNVIFEVPNNLIEKLDVAINNKVINENGLEDMSKLVSLDKFYNDSNVWLQTLKAKYKFFLLDYKRNQFNLLLDVKSRKTTLSCSEEKIENTLKQYDTDILESVSSLVDYIDSLEIPFKKAYRK